MGYKKKKTFVLDFLFPPSNLLYDDGIFMRSRRKLCVLCVSVCRFPIFFFLSYIFPPLATHPLDCVAQCVCVCVVTGGI